VNEAAVVEPAGVGPYPQVLVGFAGAGSRWRTRPSGGAFTRERGEWPEIARKRLGLSSSRFSIAKWLTLPFGSDPVANAFRTRVPVNASLDLPGAGRSSVMDSNRVRRRKRWTLPRVVSADAPPGRIPTELGVCGDRRHRPGPPPWDLEAGGSRGLLRPGDLAAAKWVAGLASEG
jgi:hypothetical protein